MDRITLSIFQANARDEKPAARLNWLDMAAERAAEEGSNILICPELYLSCYLAGEKLQSRAQPMEGEYAERISEIASLHRISIAYSYPESHGNQLFNSAGFVNAEGRLIGHHRKNHIPGDYEPKWFKPMPGISVFEYLGWKIAMLICYDIEFPETVRQAALMGAELLIVPTSALDMTVQVQIVDLLRDLQKRHKLAYLFISHDLKVVRALSHKVLVMKQGDIVEQGIGDQVFDAPKTDYTKALMKAAFDLAEV